MECRECGNSCKDSKGITFPSGLSICDLCIGAEKARNYTEWREKNKPWRMWWSLLWVIVVGVLLFSHKIWFPHEQVIFMKISTILLVVNVSGFLYMNHKKIDVY